MNKFVVLHFRGDDKMEPLSDFNTVEVLRPIPGHMPPRARGGCGRGRSSSCRLGMTVLALRGRLALGAWLAA